MATQVAKQILNVIQVVVGLSKKVIKFGGAIATVFLTIFWFLPLAVIRVFAGKGFANGMRSVVVPSLPGTSGGDSGDDEDS